MQSPPQDFRTLSARLGSDPLQVQGPGGNTSYKDGNTMWIKASGTELADALTKDIFVAVDREAAVAEAHGAGDGTCKAAVLDKTSALRPSIETTFHALLDWAVVAHTHSVATIVHAISSEGRASAKTKLAGLPFAFAPYRKPGLPLTTAIIDVITTETQIIILENHGLVCAGNDVAEVTALIQEVEKRLSLHPPTRSVSVPDLPAPPNMVWNAYAAPLATDARLRHIATVGSYYPDHVVFLGPALATDNAPAMRVGTDGVAIRRDATPSQQAMLRCLTDVLTRLPEDWTAEPIGTQAEAQLLNWDAEKYRQALAAKTDHG